MKASSDLYRKLPSVDELLRSESLAYLLKRDGHAAVSDAARVVLQKLRHEIAAKNLHEGGVDLAVAGIADAIDRQLHLALRESLRTVINATGVILHTNLGRAPLATAAVNHIRDTALGYSNLEFQIAAGTRGNRDVHVDRLFQKLFAKNTIEEPETNLSTIVVNNNAAAVLIALNTLAEGGEVIVSRGELVEIGGSFRIPEVMAKSNALLREVGTTNRTRVADYERAINERTRLILRVHRSNFQITGFTEQPSLQELSSLARERKIPLMEDLGSGALLDLRLLGVEGEAGVSDSLRAGVDVVTYSGDKLLGGPQAGILSGKRTLIARIRANPLFRALRVDKLIYAALEATLLAYVKKDHDSIPALRMMRLPTSEINRRAERAAERVISLRLAIEIIDGESVIGGGAAPSATLPTRLLAVTCEGMSADEVLTQLRQSDPPVIARVDEGRVLLDFRTVFPEQDDGVAASLLLLTRTQEH